MTTIRPSLISAVLLVATCSLVAGCGGSDESDPPATDAAASATSPTEPVFNACTDIDDDRIRRMGFVPSSREAVEPTSGELSACSFDSENTAMRISTSEMSFETFRDAEEGHRIGIDINHRPTVWVRYDRPNAHCDLAMKTVDGTVRISIQVAVNAVARSMDNCAYIKEYAAVIEPLLGE